MFKGELITSHKEILGGIPVFAGTRVPVQMLIDYIEKGHALDEFLSDFPTVQRDHARAVLKQLKLRLFGLYHESAA